MDKPETLLFIVTRMECCWSWLTTHPEGELFAVRRGDVYRGNIPSQQGLDWFNVAKKVGKVYWSNFRFILFDPNGVLYAVTGKGDIYKGPAPTNANMPWLYRQATKIGSDSKDDWFATCIPVGNENWFQLTHFMAFSPDGSFWCVNDSTGYMYKWSSQAVHSNFPQKDAQSMGWGYSAGLFFAFTCDKIISSIESLEFLPDDGKIVSQGDSVLEKQIYRNSSDTPLKHLFTVSKTVKSSSTFSEEHGFTVQAGVELTFKAGVPYVAQTGGKISVNTTTSHTWNFTKTNEIETLFSGTTEVTLEPHTSVRVTASITKGEMDVPYRARVKTMLGNETTIEGIWKGSSCFDLMVSQENYKPSALSLHKLKI
ncbi:Hypothetical predicted protein [Pelobates cultripes]|uniref:Tachylectin 2 domain-containing protein n=1 Tax=Pelobates cultripes TaxID=61616 RepID=A0AAD1SD29_PELCU|nr:Hypothetical predicted protein [Pelobates cultripes]